MSNSPIHELPGSSTLSGLILGNGSSRATSALVNFGATTNPTINDDQTQGYSIGSQWINTSSGTVYFCTSNTTGNANWSSGGGGGSSSFSVTASNSFTVGQVIAFNGTNYVLAEADNVTDAEVVGVIQSATGSVFSFVASGFLLWTSHGFTAGQVLFLSPTVPGELQNFAPVTVGQVSKPIGIALDSNNLRIFDYRAISVGADNTAKNSSQYLTLSLDTNLTNSRVATAGSGVAFTDGGAEGSLTIALDVNDLVAAVTLGESDTFPEYNVSATANKKITVANLRSLLIGSPQGTIASATTTDLSTVTNDYIQVTGTIAITGFGNTARLGVRKTLEFAGILTLTYNGTSLIIPGGVNVTTAAGDVCVVVHETSGNWRVLNYTLATGKALISNGTLPNQQIFSSSGTFTPITTSCVVILIGGGGGGGSAGGGGGAGGCGIGLVQNLTVGVGVTVTCGAAGNSNNNGGNGGTGGTSTFGTYMTCTGGVGGLNSGGTGGAPGTLSAFDSTNCVPIGHYGVQKAIGTIVTGVSGGTGTTAIGGAGGSNYFGHAGTAGSATPSNATQGSGGGGTTSATTTQTGKGGVGYCVVMW